MDLNPPAYSPQPKGDSNQISHNFIFVESWILVPPENGTPLRHFYVGTLWHINQGDVNPVSTQSEIHQIMINVPFLQWRQNELEEPFSGGLKWSFKRK